MPNADVKHCRSSLQARSQDFLPHAVGVRAPLPRRDRIAHAARDAREPVATGPGDRRGERVALHAAAEFPRTRVGLLEGRDGAFAEAIQALEQDLVARAHQAFVEEELRGREDHRAVHVVLHLFGGEIAEAHRAHAAITRRGVVAIFSSARGSPVMPYSGCSVSAVDEAMMWSM